MAIFGHHEQAIQEVGALNIAQEEETHSMFCQEFLQIHLHLLHNRKVLHFSLYKLQNCEEEIELLTEGEKKYILSVQSEEIKDSCSRTHHALLSTVDA